MEKSLVARLKLDISGYLASLGKASAATGAFAREMSGAGTASTKHIQAVGRGALLMAGAVGAGMGLAAKAAIDWESAWAGVQKVTKGNAQEMQVLEDQLRELATTLPASHKEIAAVAEAAGQLGIKREAVAQFTETMVALGVSTNLTADEAATSIAQLMNIMQTAPNDVERLGATLVALGNAGASTESQILEMSKRLAGAGQLIGASESDVMALANAMASVGIEAQLGGGAMSRSMAKIHSAVIDGGEDLQGFADVALGTGADATKFAEMWRSNPVAAVDLFVKGLGRINAEGGNVKAVLDDLTLRGTQDRDVLLRLAGAGTILGESLKLAGDEWERAEALQAEATRRYGTTESQMKMLRNKVEELQIQFGDYLLPVLSGVVDGLSGVTGAISGLPGPVKVAVVGLGGIATAGAAVIGIVGTMAPKLQALDRALEAMGRGSNVASGALGRLGTLAAKGAAWAAAFMIVGEGLDAIFDKDYTGGDKGITELQNALVRLAQGDAIADLDIDIDQLKESLQELFDPTMVDRIYNFGNEITSLGGILGESNDHVDEAKERLDGFDKSLARMVEAGNPELAARALELLKQAVGPEFAGRLDDELLDDYAIALLGLDTAGRTGADGLKDVGNAAGVSKDSLDDLNDAIKALMDQLFGVESAQDAWQQQLNDLDDAIQQAADRAKENGESFDLTDVLLGTSDAAIAVREHLRGTVEAGAELVAQWAAAGVSGEDLRARMVGLVEGFVAAATQAGLSEEAARKYAEELYGIPTDITTKVHVDTTTLEDRIKAIKQQLSSVGGSIDAAARNYPTKAGPVVGPGLVPGQAAGGPAGSGPLLAGPTGTDTIPALLSPGEFDLRPLRHRKESRAA